MRHNRLGRDDGAKHRLVYEHVRVQLGRVMLASPLAMEEIMGILIMSLFSTSPSQGPEYLDSWLLSGHCAQHWAATTGRPSVLPGSYLRQCRALLCFDQATMRDGMLYAEICLFTILHDLSSQESAIGHDGTCDEISEWRQEWNHLFELPTSTVLKLGYRIAWLVLVRRSQERLRTLQSDSHTSADHDGAAAQDAQSLVYRHAVRVIEAFVAIPETDCANLPEFYLLSVAYSILVLSKNGTDSPGGPDTELIHLLEEVGRRAAREETMPVVLRFGVNRALRKVRCAIGASNVALQPETLPGVGAALGGNLAVLPAELLGPGFDIQDAVADVPVSPYLEHGSLDGMEFFFSGGHMAFSGEWEQSFGS
ncbi:hypothetical protein ACJ41O_000708 [Fusarium nematophilum]